MSEDTLQTRRIYYNNFASHLLNAYSPNVIQPGLPYRWSDADRRRCIDMVAACGDPDWSGDPALLIGSNRP